MTPQVLVRYLETVYSMTPQVLVRYLEKYINDSSSIGEIPRKAYSMTPQVLVRYLEKYIQWLLKYWSDT